jgi:hypothetical protein
MHRDLRRFYRSTHDFAPHSSMKERYFFHWETSMDYI